MLADWLHGSLIALHRHCEGGGLHVGLRHLHRFSLQILDSTFSYLKEILPFQLEM